jgi:hypothetical protein
MRRTTERTKRIRSFLLDKVSDHPRNLVAITCKHFGLSRRAINRHIKGLVEEGLLVASGVTRQRSYSLAVTSSHEVASAVENLEEHVLWRREVAPLLKALPTNAQDIWHYGFTEMANNVIDHSSGSKIVVSIESTAVSTIMWIMDDGIGIFRKIKAEMGLEDERHAVLELSKGKLTTDPENHTGEGIFFSSRVFDEYAILSGEVLFSHQVQEDEDWIMERERPETGTAVYMSLRNSTERTTSEVFDKYASKNGDYGFTRTVVPVRLLRHGVEKLVSRSQAKRLLARFERFKVVVLDFSGVDIIGQAFADEIFRVFPAHNPEVKIVPIHMGSDVKRMVARAKQTGTLLP